MFKTGSFSWSVVSKCSDRIDFRLQGVSQSTRPDDQWKPRVASLAQVLH